VVIAGPKPGDENNNLVVYALPRLWNPHRGSTTGDQPKIRIGIAGQLSARCFWGKEGVPPAGYPKAANDPKVPNMVIDGIVATAELAAVDTFPQPRYPAASDFASALSDNAAGIVWAPLPAAVGQHGGSSFVGFRFPDFHVDSTKMEDTGATDKLTLMTRFGNLTGAGTATSVANIYLEFRTPSGQWIPYAFFSGINDSATWMATVSNWSNRIGVSSGSGKFIYSPNPWTPDLLLAPDWFLKSDPRTSRISPVQMFQMAGMNVNPQPSLWSPNAPTSGGPANNLNFSRNGYGGGEQGTSGPFPRQADVIPNNDSSNGFYGGTSFFGNFYYPAWLSRNFGPNTSTGDQSSPRTSTYVDVDGVRRIADSGRYMNELPTGANAPTTGNPYWRQEDKPVVLNRPFESVGEMGYAFRDLPWKTLDFFSENSADAGLLDFFALTDADISVAADRLNVQNAPAEVLDALLAGTPVDVANSASAIFSQTAAWNISRKLAGTNSIMGSSADLVTRWVGPLAGDTTNPSTLPLLTDSDFDSSDIARVKPYREAIVRSLGGTSDLRTWNLMVDLIAQWGRFPPSAIGAADFIVNGEKRYWLHLSIDRFTGEVVSRQLEAVAE